jgi:hypothetical protein
VEPGDEHFIDLPKNGADTKVMNLQIRVEHGYTVLPRSTALVIGNPKSGNPDEVGVYIRRKPNTV